MRNSVWLAAWLMASVWAQTERAVQKPAEIEADVRSALKDQSAILVVIDTQDKYWVIPVSGVAEVQGSKLTMRAQSFLYGPGTFYGDPNKPAVLVDIWKMLRDVPAAHGVMQTQYDKEGKKLAAGGAGKLKEALTIEVKLIVLSSKEK